MLEVCGCSYPHQQIHSKDSMKDNANTSAAMVEESSEDLCHICVLITFPQHRETWLGICSLKQFFIKKKKNALPIEGSGHVAKKKVPKWHEEMHSLNRQSFRELYWAHWWDSGLELTVMAAFLSTIVCVIPRKLLSCIIQQLSYTFTLTTSCI